MPQCSICFKCFTHEGNLQAHIRSVHFGDRRRRPSVRYTCEICFKTLCSKRSYDEHQNTHSNSRPFKCNRCSYAAASQMTLRRHNLRQHVSKREWHYRCPYCSAAFVEPTSYQSHLQHKHPGRSGTFGCIECSFTTLSSRVFTRHLLKHNRGEIVAGDEMRKVQVKLMTSSSSSMTSSLPSLGWPMPVHRYLIDDDLGCGCSASSTSIAQKPVFYNNNNAETDSESEGSESSGSDSSSEESDQEFWTGDRAKRMKLLHQKHSSSVAPFEQTLNPALFSFDGIPDACEQVEICCSSSTFIHDDIKNINTTTMMYSDKFTTREKSIPHETSVFSEVLPDGQVDFELD